MEHASNEAVLIKTEIKKTLILKIRKRTVEIPEENVLGELNTLRTQ